MKNLCVVQFTKKELMLFNCTVTATLLSAKMCKNATACIKSARRCIEFAVCKRFLKIFVRCNLQKELSLFNYTVTATLLSVKMCKNATACLKISTIRFAILFARGFWMKFTKRQHAKSSALSKNRVRPFRHVAKFVQEK